MADAHHRTRVTNCERPECCNLVKQTLKQGRPRRYCSPVCRKHAHQKQVMLARDCAWCKSEFEPSRPNRLYCSPQCQKSMECDRRKKGRSVNGESPRLLAAKRERRKELYATPAGRLRERLRNAIKKAVRRAGLKATWSKSRLLTFTDAELVAHFETIFEPGMSWDNFGEWHVDHVRPLASYEATEADMREANRLQNLRPMWAADNIANGSLHQGERHRYSA